MAEAITYERRRPEAATLYEVVRDNLETLYGAIDEGALDVRVPKHAKKELEAFLDCGLLCRGFARLLCESCGESRVVAWSCKGRGFCPSCMGRRMCATSANLIENVQTQSTSWTGSVNDSARALVRPFAWARGDDDEFVQPAAPRQRRRCRASTRWDACRSRRAMR